MFILHKSSASLSEDQIYIVNQCYEKSLIERLVLLLIQHVRFLVQILKYLYLNKIKIKDFLLIFCN